MLDLLQAELEKISEGFLHMDSNKEEFVVEDRNGIPVLKALFDVMQFKSEEIHVKTEGGTLDIILYNLDSKTPVLLSKRGFVTGSYFLWGLTF